MFQNKNSQNAEYNDVREQVLLYAKRMYEEGLVFCTSGNISARVPGETDLVAITPSCEDYRTMRLEQIILLTLGGAVVAGEGKPSSEWRMHTGIYKKRPDVGAIVHTHSQYATAFAVLRESIPAVLVEMRPWLGGSIPLAAFAQPGTENLAAEALAVLESRHACLLSNHGVLAVADTLDLAYVRAAYAEDAARIYHHARAIGQPTTPSEE